MYLKEIKKINLSLLLFGVATFFVACSSGNQNTVEATDAGNEANATESSVTYVLDTDATTLEWRGSKVTGDHHVGVISISEGSLDLEGDSIVSGKFVVDMTSIDETNSSSEKMEAKLVGHLKSADFFLVDSFPTAVFVVTGFSGDQVTGNLTLKGITKEISIPVSMVEENDKITVNSTFAIDRSQWNVQYRSRSFFEGLGDKMINDDIEFTLNLVAAK